MLRLACPSDTSVAPAINFPCIEALKLAKTKCADNSIASVHSTVACSDSSHMDL